ncbi:MAG TPA: hypothetical protein VGI57_07700, partial [Usitatibacter sp.]
DVRTAAARRALAFAIVGHVAFVATNSPAAESTVRARPAIRLEMLVERIAKLNAQVGQDILAARSRRSLDEAIRDFDETLAAVSATAPGAEARDNYNLLTLLWVQYRAWAVKPTSRDAGRKLRDRTEEMAFVAAKGTRLVQESARATSNASAIRAENAAVLAQRIAKIHLWMRWDMHDEALERALRESTENLRRILATLGSTPGNTPEISDELVGANAQMRFLDDAARDLAQHQSEARSIEFIAKAGDHIQVSMERVAGLYEAVAPTTRD